MERARQISIISLGAVVLLFGGCFPRPDYIAPGFVPDSAFTQGVVVGGVAVVENPAGESMYAQFLERSLRDQGRYKVSGGALVEQAIGTERYAGLLKQYRENHSINSEILEIIRSELTGFRYIVFVHFDKSHVRHKENKEDVYGDKGKKVSARITRVATRTAKARLTVYDLSNGNVVIKDREDVHASNENGYTEPSKNSSFGDFLWELLLPGDKEDKQGPAIPGSDEVVKSGLTRVYKILATNERCFLMFSRHGFCD